MYKRRSVFLVLVAIFVVTISTLCVCLTKKANAASLSGASVTMANSRLSFKGKISSGSAGSSIVTIQAGSSDATTTHLFPGDVLCFTDQGENVCRDNQTYTVASIINATQFDLTSPLITALTTTDYAVATQAGTWTITFTTVNAVPIGGKLIITIPMADNANGNNGIPDSAATIPLGGFDMNKTATASATVTASSCPGGTADWGTAGAATSIVTGYGTNDHVITWNRTAAICTGAATITVSIAGNGIENPGGMIGKTQGNADVYGVTVATNDGTNTIDSAVPRVAPVEAVLISGTVDETLSFQVQGLSSGGTYCGNQASVSATPTSIPWGHPVTNFFVYADQQLTVSTNSAGGYAVTIQENDQMGKNGNVCTSGVPSSGNYTFGSGTCIRDTLCGASACSESVAADWTSPTGYPGLGFSVASQSGTDAPFFWSEKNRAWSARTMADKENSETPAVIMSNSGPVSGNSIYVCYRIAIPGTQPAGYYYNIAKYTATATF